jgi:hypothetical protein
VRAASLLVLLAASCELDNTLTGSKEEEGAFETGDTFQPPFECHEDNNEDVWPAVVCL